jgi:hypothetical protein
MVLHNSVLVGATRLIKEYRPLFSFELHVLYDYAYSLKTLQYAAGLDYEVYMINELCGKRKDCRNFLAFPRGQKDDRGLDLFLGSSILDISTIGGLLIRVNGNNASHSYLKKAFKRHENTASKWQSGARRFKLQ